MNVLIDYVIYIYIYIYLPSFSCVINLIYIYYIYIYIYIKRQCATLVDGIYKDKGFQTKKTTDLELKVSC